MATRRSTRSETKGVNPSSLNDDGGEKNGRESTLDDASENKSGAVDAPGGGAAQGRASKRSSKKRSGSARASRPPSSSSGAKAKKASSSAAALEEPIDETNRLKRDTAFLCPMQFRNNLPPPRAHDWKLLRRKGSIDDDFAEHNVACLYDGLRRSANFLPEDLGITLDPLGTDAFRAEKVKPELHPDDQILLASDSKTDSQGGRKGRRADPDVNKAMWLMNTKYISEGGLSLKTGISEKSNLILRRQKELEKLEGKDAYVSEREKQIAAIKKSFESSESLTLETVKHPKNKNVKPVSVKPVFPDFKKWQQNFVRLTFDEEPTLDVEGMGDASETIKERVMRSAIVKPMMVEDEGGRPEKFMTLLLPKDVKSAAENFILADEGSENGTEYDWIREYKYAVKTEGINTVCFYVRKDRVTYADLNTKISCQKKSKSSKGREGQSWKPVSVDVRKRKRTVDEEEKRKNKLAAIDF